MTDKEFIDKLNDIFINYGYIVIDRNNYQYYFDRYCIKNYYKEYFEGRYFYRFQLFDIKDNVVKIGFKSIHNMIDDPWSIFEYAKRDIYEYAKRDIYDYMVKIFSIEFSNFMLSIEGKTKEEILLKIQMMGY